jgi:serine protease Do
VVRGSIGISFPRVQKQEELKAYGYDHGVVVEKVTPGGPAAEAGVKSEDIVLALNGKPVKDGDDLVARIAEMPVGTKLTLTIDRGGHNMEKQLVIDDREKVFKDDPRFAGRRPQMTEPDDKTENTSVRFGLGLRALGEELHKELPADETGGVQVTTVEEDSFADEIGIKEKDVILSINRQPVGSFEDVKKIQAKLKPGDAVAFRVLRKLPGATRGQFEWNPAHLSGTLPKE